MWGLLACTKYKGKTTSTRLIWTGSSHFPDRLHKNSKVAAQNTDSTGVFLPIIYVFFPLWLAFSVQFEDDVYMFTEGDLDTFLVAVLSSPAERDLTIVFTTSDNTANGMYQYP